MGDGDQSLTFAGEQLHPVVKSRFSMEVSSSILPFIEKTHFMAFLDLKVYTSRLPSIKSQGNIIASHE